MSEDSSEVWRPPNTQVFKSTQDIFNKQIFMHLNCPSMYLLSLHPQTNTHFEHESASIHYIHMHILSQSFWENQFLFLLNSHVKPIVISGDEKWI